MPWIGPDDGMPRPSMVGRCILCGPVSTPGMWAHFNSDSHQSMVLLNLQVEIALPDELRR